MIVTILNPDGTATTEEAPAADAALLPWLQEKVGGYVEEVRYLNVVLTPEGLTRSVGTMFVNEEGALPHKGPLPMNYLATLLYLEASRQRDGVPVDAGYPAVIHGVAVLLHEEGTIQPKKSCQESTTPEATNDVHTEAERMFRDAVKAHDMSYEHSDDYRVWRAARAEERRLRAMARALGEGRAEAIWNGVVNAKFEGEARQEFFWPWG
jgi:hypothetical protein